MPDYNIPYFEVEAVIAEWNEADARDFSRPLFFLFPPKGQRAPKVKIRTIHRRPNQIRHTTWGGRAVPVERGQIKERFVEPSVFKVFDHLTTEDEILFADAETAINANEIEGANSPAVVEANDRIQQFTADLREGVSEEKHRMCVGACLGQVEVLIYDATEPITVDYGLAAITPPSPLWSAVDGDGLGTATIVADGAAALTEFRNNNPRGLSPQLALHGPGLYSRFLVNNKQWNEYIKHSPAMAEGFLRVPGGKNPFELTGEIQAGWLGLRWVMIEGTYMADDGVGNYTETARWPDNTIVLINVNGAQPRWQMVLSRRVNPTTEVNVEVKLPQVGDDVKEISVLAMYNGIPIFLDPTCVQVWEIAAPD